MGPIASIGLADVHAEERLLAVMLTQRMAPATALGMGIKRDDYAWEINAIIHEAINQLIQTGHSVDATTVSAHLESMGMLDVIGGRDRVEYLAAQECDPNILSEYVAIVRDRSLRRRIQSSLEGVAQTLHSEPDGRKLIDSVQTQLFRAVDPYLSSAYSGIKACDMRQMWESRVGEGEVMPYGFNNLNAVNRGRKRGALTIWGGYTSDGKSIVGQTEAINGCRLGLKVGYFQLEMSDEEMVARLLSMMTGIDSRRVESGAVNSAERGMLDDAFKELGTWNLTIYADPSIEPSDIVMIQQRERYDLIVIDYLQRFDFREYKEIPRIAKQFKNLALSTKCCVDLLSQLTPKQIEPGGNPYTKPDTQSLYGGKATAHEADNVNFVYAHRVKDEQGAWIRNGAGSLIVAKARGGRTDWSIPLEFDADAVTWREC